MWYYRSSGITAVKIMRYYDSNSLFYQLIPAVVQRCSYDCYLVFTVLFIRHVGSIRLLGINHKVISRVKYVAKKIVMGMVMGKI